jgi:hypothetical protein
MEGDGGLLGCSGAQGNKGRGFYRHAEAVPSHRRGLQETPAWARSSGDVRRGRRPMGRSGSSAGECAPAVWHRPRPPHKRHGDLVHSVTGTGLGPLGLSAPRRARGPGTARPTWRRTGDVVRGMPAFQTVSFSPFQTAFSPKIQTEVTRTLNTKVVEQVTL